MTPKIVKAQRKRSTIKQRQEWCDLYFKQKISVSSIADTYGVTTSTVYNALGGKTKTEKSPRTDKGVKRNEVTLELPDVQELTLDGESIETQLELFITSCMQSIRKAKALKPNQLIYYTDKMLNALKKLRSLQVAGMIKNTDAKVVERIIRRYEPNASDMRVIQVFKEELAKAKT